MGTRTKGKIILVFCFFCVLFIVRRDPAYAIPGQLNNLLNPPTPFVVQPLPTSTKTQTDLNECRKQKEEMSVSLKNCQDATALLKTANDISNSEKQKYLTITVVTGTAATIILIILVLVLILKKRPIVTTTLPQ